MFCGVDEAGRGPVMGPLVVGAVYVEDDDILRSIGVKDSKKLTPRRREAMYDEIISAVEGYSIITLSQKSKVTKFIAGLFAICFSITIGVAWEFTEFTFDRFVKTDAQKDAYVKNIATITMQRDGGNTPVQVNNITTTDIHLTNGEVITVDQGYLDIGLLDTMKDLFVNTAGALLFCAIGAFSAEGHHKSKITRHFVLTKK